MRPLVMDFRSDKIARASVDQFMFGPSLLINPVTKPSATSRQVYLPEKSAWIDFWTGESLSGGQTIQAAAPIARLPIFVRAGSILPYGPTVDYADEKLSAPIELRIYPGADADFTLYEDEGDSYDYERGSFATVDMHWDDTKGVLTVGSRKGSFQGMSVERQFQVVRVRPGHGIGVAPTEKPDAVLTFKGQPIMVHP
jgi:alpha-D-xyloside xylohydrolase